MTNIEIIFEKKFKIIEEAKRFLKNYYNSISSLKVSDNFNSKFKIYDFESKLYLTFDSEKKHLIEGMLKTQYDQSWMTEIRFNNKWILDLETLIKKVLSENKDLRLFCNFFSSSLLSQNDVHKEILQLFIQSLKKLYVYDDETGAVSGIDSSWFYLEFGKILSDFFIGLKFKSNEEFLFKLKEEFFDLEEIKLFAFFSEKKANNLISIFNFYFGSNYNNDFSKVIEHFLLKNFLEKFSFDKSEKEYYNLNKKLNIQYLEFSSILLNEIFSKFFDEKFFFKDKKTQKKFFPKDLDNSELNLIINSGLPSLFPDSFTDKNNILYKNGNDFTRKIIFNNNYLHESLNLKAILKDKSKKILKNLKKLNEFEVDLDFLLFILCIFEKKDISLVKEVYDIDIISIVSELSCKNNIIEWVFDLDNSAKFYDNEIKKSHFINKFINTIYSKKLLLRETLKQACIMSCFDVFYYNWFFDSRGRIYVEPTSLNIQGSKISRLLVIPKLEHSKKINPENLLLMRKTLYSYVKNSFIDIEKINPENIKDTKHFNFYILWEEFMSKINNKSSYALDASNSGLQVLSIFLKNLNLAQKCNLLLNDNHNDIYTRVSEHLTLFLENCVLENKHKDMTDIWNSIPTLKDLIKNRKFTKMPIMTIPYNSTLYGRVAQMEKVFIKNCLLTGNLINNSDLYRIRKFFNFIDKIIISWCRKEIPECFNFIKNVKDFISNKNIDNFSFSNDYIKFKYRMTCKVYIRRKIGIKKDKKSQKLKIGISVLKSYHEMTSMQKLKLRNKINNSYIANLIHSLDAFIALNLIEFFIKKKIPFYTIHDCFRIDYDYAFVLRKAIYDSYIKLFNLNFFKKNKLNNFISKSNSMDLDTFKKKFNYDNFVKE